MATKSTREAAMLAIQELARKDDKIVVVSRTPLLLHVQPSFVRSSLSA